MNFGKMVFLSAIFYTKDGAPRAYATFADASNGEVFNFNASGCMTASNQPRLFDVCEVVGEMRRYQNNVSFSLHECKHLTSLVPTDKGVL